MEVVVKDKLGTELNHSGTIERSFPRFDVDVEIEVPVGGNLQLSNIPIHYTENYRFPSASINIGITISRRRNNDNKILWTYRNGLINPNRVNGEGLGPLLLFKLEKHVMKAPSIHIRM